MQSARSGESESKRRALQDLSNKVDKGRNEKASLSNIHATPKKRKLDEDTTANIVVEEGVLSSERSFVKQAPQTPGSALKTPMRIKKIPRTPASKSTQQDFTPAPKTPRSPAFVDQLTGDVRRLKVQSSPSANKHKPFPHIPSHSAMEELLKEDDSDNIYSQEPFQQQPQTLNRNLHHTEFSVNHSSKSASTARDAAQTAHTQSMSPQQQEQ